MAEKRVVECVPNFSEGRRPEIIDEIVSEASRMMGLKVLDVAPDASHNRVVVTMAGLPEAVEEAAFRMTAKAAQLIDMNQHRGEHPRIGATDVIPFVPVSGVTMEECCEMARRVAKRIAEELGIPTYLYAKAATRPDRVRLPDIRRGEYEGLRDAIKDPARHPDFGKPQLHPTAGATVVGARPPLIAFNANLNTQDVEIAKAVAKAVRESSGGLMNVQAKGIMIEEKKCAQVTMNLLDYERTPMARVLEMVKTEAARYGVQVIETEIVGLVPLNALLDSACWYLRVGKFSRQQILDLSVE
ncbi:MAG TPA: glutamate formimidoyltransferase [Firmicutes bacterium]|nr:glutamate formimidoyltransferase [Bacillota bacterium]